MNKTLPIIFGLILATGGVAYAQHGDGHDGPSPDMHGPHKGWHHGHKDDHHMPPPPAAPLKGKGFDLEMGHGKSLRVQCADEDMADCMTAVQPLIDALESHGGPHGHPPMPGQGAANDPGSANGQQSMTPPDQGPDNGSTPSPSNDGASGNTSS